MPYTFPGATTFPDPSLYPTPDPADFREWDAFQATSLTAINFDNLDVNTEYEVQVRAVSTDGVTSDWTESVYVVTPDDVEPPAAPSAPLVASKLGYFTITWDGHTYQGGAMPPDFDHINVYASGTFIGSIRVPSDSVVWATPSYTTTYHFTLSAVDTSGNESDRSTVTDAVVTPLVNTDIIGKIIAGANIVDGSIVASDKIVGNSITGDLIQANAITADKIDANAITAEKIDAGALNGLTISGVIITGGTVKTGSRSDATHGQGVFLDSSGLLNARSSSRQFFSADSAAETLVIGNPSGANLTYDSANGIQMSDIKNLIVNMGFTNAEGDFGAFRVIGLQTDPTDPLSDRGLSIDGTGIHMDSCVLDTSLTNPFDINIHFGSFSVHGEDSGTGSIYVGSDGSGARITLGGILWSTSTYDNILTGGVGMFIGSAGQIFRQSSAARYKAAIEDMDAYPAILDIKPRVWHDKTASDRYADMLVKANGDEKKFKELVDASGIADPFTLIPGVVAEEVEAAGLKKFVIYGDSGEPEGVMYDRLWIPLIPIIRDLRDRITALETKLAQEGSAT